MRIGIIGAMDIEVEALKNEIKDRKSETVSGIEFNSGFINGTDTVVAVAGVGKVNAAVCAEAMILKYSPDLIINIGVAGGLSKELRVCDIAVATAVVEHDMDTSPLGDPVGFITGLNAVYIDCDKIITEAIYDAAINIEGIKVIKGVIASGDQFVSSQDEKNRIITQFNAIATEMEGASIGHVCKMNGVGFGVLRAISDGANDDANLDFPAFAKIAAANSVKITLEMLSKLS